ncbi:T9SS type B sorting domain-containing protein [Olleya sp. R77988]|uniref:T9SS type B sorting domain-containing protein n=1 Tax=Olleya sp. R77988 TaxID=3093875 RepID=UPI0037C7AEC4
MRKIIFFGFFVLLFTQLNAQQEPNDCVDAVTVCGNGSFMSNATGSGDDFEVNACSGFEHNSLWLEVNIVQAGTLGFDLIPNDPSTLVDYDFWVYGPNAVCSNLGNPIRCATTNPDQAGLANNLTGINGSTTLTQTGPGANGNGYVFWLNVNVGESYFIVIDRPAGDGGFEIQWTGTATTGTGAFPTPPTANQIDDQIQCSSTPDIGIFNLNGLQSSINLDLVNNTIEFYETLADATDGINPLPGIYANTSNPQQIYAKVYSGGTDCYSLVDFNLIVSPIPSATLAVSNLAICEGDNVTFTITGTPNSTIHYTENGVAQNILLDTTGMGDIIQTPTTDVTFELVDAQILNNSGVIICSQTLADTQTVTVTNNTIPTIINSSPICEGEDGELQFSGDPNAIIAYNIDSGSSQTFNLDNTGDFTLTIPALISNTDIEIVSVTNALNPNCVTAVNSTETIIVQTIDDASFTMLPTCDGGVTDMVTTSGGSYAFNPTPTDTAVIDSTTGTITNGVSGTTYTVEYTTNGTCPAISIETVTVYTAEDAAFSVIENCSGATMNIIGDMGGVFTFNPIPTDAVNIDSATGEVTNGTSGTTYTVEYTTTGPCPENSFQNVTVLNQDDPSFTVLADCNGGTIDSVVTPGGTYVFNPAATDGATIDLATGTVTNGVSGTSYTIEYTTAGACPTISTQQLNIPLSDDPSFTIQPTCDGGFVDSITTPGGTFTFNTPPTDAATIDASSGLITDGDFGSTYSVDYTTNGPCPETTNQTVTVHLGPTAITPTPLEVCDDGTPDGFTSIDLSLKNNEISGGNPVYSVTYYESQVDAEAGINVLSIPYTNISNPQIIFVRVEDTTTGCFTTTTLQLDVQQAPVAFTPADLLFCDPDSDGFGVFTLTDSEAEITGGVAGLTVTYHETSADADNNVNPLTSPYNNIVEDMQTIYVRVESATILTACATFVDLVLIVNPTPQITDPSPLEVCDNDADGIATFDLELNNPEILNQLDADATNDLAAADYTITFYTTEANAEVPQNAIATPNAYINTTPNMQTIWVRVDDNTNGCETITSMDLIVNPLPVLVQPTPLALCDYNNPGDEVEAFNLEDANAEILAGQTGITLTHYLTQLGADTADPADQISSPYTNVVNPQTVYIRAEDNVTGCVSTITLDLRVNPIPSPVVNPTPLVECDDDNDGFTTFDLDSQTATILNSEPDVSISYHETSADAANDLNPLVSPYTNIVAYNQMIYVRAENDLTGCITVVILPLEVQDSPVVPVVLDDYIVCDDNNDGFNQFDFDTVMTPQILGTQNPADFVLTYHTTLLNAENGTSPIVNTGNYTNATNPQTIYIRLEGIANGCVTTGEFIIRVEAPPVIVQPTPLAICDELDANYYENNDDMATFDLTVKNDEITAGNVSWIVTYYETQADADADANAIADPTMYTNMMVGTNPANPQTVYVRVTDADTGCFSFTTLTIRVLPNPTPTPTPDNLELCDDVNVVGPNDLIEIFDLTTNEVATINGETGVSASYYTDLDEALMGTNQIVDPTMHSNEDPANPGAAITPQTIYVRVTNGTDAMGTAGTGCYTIVSFDVIVNPLPVVSPIEDYIYCELFNDGQYGFDLDSKTDEILNGQDPTIFTVTYHETQGEADTSMNALSSPYTNTSNPQTIFVNITNTVTGCDTTTTFNIEVQEAAQANPDMAPIVYEICDDNMETDGDTTNDSAQFDLLTQNPDVLDGQDAANYIVSYYATQTDADAATNPLPFLYENTVNPQVIYVRVDNDIQSVGPISLDLVALGTTGLDVNGDGAIDTIDTDGDGVFDLLDVNNDMVSDGFDNEPDGIIDFIDLDGDGLGDLVDLDNDGVVDNGIDSSICYETAEVTLQVNPLPEFEIEDSYLLCINTNGTEVINTPVIDTGLNTTDYTFEWLLEGATLTGETGSSLTPTQGGNYTVIVTDVTTSGVTMCQNSATTLVEESEPPVIEYEVTTEAFADVHNIMVTATGNGISAYEFQLNDGVWEAGVLNTDGSYTYTFTDVAGGDHIVTARDINGCGESSLPVSVMDYPHFFTPNDDGFNDTWNIYGIQNQPDAVIYIFDRYGKLLKQLSPTGLGWDGTFNGNPMPTSDYWFTIDYKEPNDLTQQKQFKAHFTLKR